MRSSGFHIFAFLLVAGLFFGCSDTKEKSASSIDAIKKAASKSSSAPGKTQSIKGITSDPDSEQVADLIQKEKLIRETGKTLRKLGQAVKQLRIETSALVDLFKPEVDVNDIVSFDDESTDGTRGVGLESKTGYSGPTWQPFFQQVEFFENARFYNIRVEDYAEDSHVTKTGFEGLAFTDKGVWLSVKGKGKIHWTRLAAGANWKISKWDLSSFDVVESRFKPFEKVTANILEQREYAKAAASPQRAMFLNVLRKGNQAFPNATLRDHFRHIPVGQHAAISIVDINDDGFDDFYLSEQFRNNRLYVNSGSGTFDEASSKYGLNQGGLGTCAMFADFDNDGDKDLFQGNSLTGCQYFENTNGRFEDKTGETFPNGLPSLVSSLSSADFNNDGLLDLYVSTYGFPAGRGPSKNWMDVFLPEDEANRVRKMIASPDHNRYLDAAGPPNLLLVNRGGRFEVAKQNEQLKVYRNTLQSTWSDFDNDGDADLFVSNDFAQDYLFRNDGDKGFKDVTREVGDDTMMGFGMGAAWGDINLDGRRDLYISNMYSKAGMRIVDHFAKLDQRYIRSANGNRLYMNQNSGLSNSIAANSIGADVHKAGWSWGGQMVDFDNDGFLDIYVASGYFTAPRVLASDKDL